ncbi:GAF domain-containing protein [Ramlibacter sp. RBP-2]|uniref:GAF domain-containing protein n=1 Tax=Ramlibacter lithotrophicus TaxID=2606681 RepID=A0A7X6I7Z4_9BURK|nr:GAF domain-containing protein [Ramlibacter lithotrophicus]NKE67928.1 GAF domain-containing protein [Ramlibacter lithotrophicus]
MPLPASSESRRARLAAIAREYTVATADFASDDRHKALSEFLARVRAALGMDIAFVSQFVDDQRVFRIVSVATQGPSPVAPGNSDPLVDSYCKRIVEGRLPRAIPDTSASAEASALAITRRLAIGSYLSVPIVLRNGEVYGTLCCFSHQARPDLGESDVLGLQDVASVIAAGIDRAGGA